jgi:hypothetical protein
MKFGKQLEEYELPEWKGQYINYHDLKKRLEALKDKYGDEADVEPQLRRANSWRANSDDGVPTSPLLFRVVGNYADNSKASELSPAGAWRQMVDSEAMRVSAVVDWGFDNLKMQLEDVQAMLPKTARDPADVDKKITKEEKYLELRIMEALYRVSEGLTRLRQFADMNQAAIYKILKKHDKALGSDYGLKELRPDIHKRTKIGKMERFDKMDEDVKEAMRHIGKDAADVSPEVARLVAGLGTMGKSAMLNTHDKQKNWNEQILCFFLGASIMSCFFLFVFMMLPPLQHHTYHQAYFLTSFAVFRLPLSVVLCVWGMGFVARMCETSFINHMFLLGVDPRCHVQDRYLFGIAAILTTAWVFIFGLYTVDYKWMVVRHTRNEFHSETIFAYDSRASWHFVLYPICLLIITIAIFIAPSKVCRYRFKGSLLKSVARVMVAPFVAVSFGDNIVGDVMTSLAKPLQDIPSAVCYLFSEHPQTRDLVTEFKEKGSTCPDWVPNYILPIIAGLPYWFRLLQCGRRYFDTREQKHLLNLGKYFTSLMVVVVTACGGSILLIIFVSSAATIYSAAWDVLMDWGLGAQELVIFACQINVGNNGSSLEEEELTKQRTDSALGWVPKAPDPSREKEQLKRNFSARFYWCAVIFDILARCAWVLTLMPLGILSHRLIEKATFNLVMSAIEIARRSLWSVLRMEYEQISNASGFRALLWVPKKMNQDYQDFLVNAVQVKMKASSDGATGATVVETIRVRSVEAQYLDKAAASDTGGEEKENKEKNAKKQKKDKKEKAEKARTSGFDDAKGP